MITENILSNYGIEDPENDKNIEMNFEMKDSKLMNENKISQIENLSQKVDSISEKIQNLNIDSNSFSQSNDNISIFTKENLNEKYNQLESKKHLLKYGENIYTYNRLLSVKNSIPENFLFKHKLTPYARMKMVDWMVEVLSVFNCMDETFFLSVNIMDIFYFKTKKVLCNEDVHLIGIASMFISSKFQEIYPLSLKNCVSRIGHDLFSENDVKKMECQILEDIGLDILVTTSVYDFLKTYFYDFYYNNNKLIKNNCDMNVYSMIKLTAKYLSKLVVHYEYFYKYENSMKAIGCIVTAVKLVGFYLKEKFTQNDRNIYSQWIMFLLDQDNFDKQKMETLVNKIYLIFNHYPKSKSISKNLNRFMKLPFLNENEQ